MSLFDKFINSEILRLLRIALLATKAPIHKVIRVIKVLIINFLCIFMSLSLRGKIQNFIFRCGLSLITITITRHWNLNQKVYFRNFISGIH